VDVQVVLYSKRPVLWESISDLSADVWPEYNRHGEVLNRYWARLYEESPEWQFALVDADSGQVLAEGRSVPVARDGTASPRPGPVGRAVMGDVGASARRRAGPADRSGPAQS
jgi:hypothetical protein